MLNLSGEKIVSVIAKILRHGLERHKKAAA